MGSLYGVEQSLLPDASGVRILDEYHAEQEGQQDVGRLSRLVSTVSSVFRRRAEEKKREEYGVSMGLIGHQASQDECGTLPIKAAKIRRGTVGRVTGPWGESSLMITLAIRRNK